MITKLLLLRGISRVEAQRSMLGVRVVVVVLVVEMAVVNLVEVVEAVAVVLT